MSSAQVSLNTSLAQALKAKHCGLMLQMCIVIRPIASRSIITD